MSIDSGSTPDCGSRSACAIDAIGTSVLRLPERHAGWVKDVSRQLRGVDWQVGHGARRTLDSIQH